MILVEATSLRKYFPLRASIFSTDRRAVHALDGVSLAIEEGETMGLVGESGCGKTTLGRTLIGLEEPTSGTVQFKGRSIFELDQSEMRELRGQMQIVFQNPFASLNPRKTIRQTLLQPYLLHKRADGGDMDRTAREESVLELLDMVGLTPAQTYMNRYPHEFSGGQRQRVVIARAMALHPKLVIADEPVSSLDVSMKAQITNLMLHLQRQFKMTYLFITHDLAVLRSVATRVAVMYLGKIVELAENDELYKHPLHPYTEAILSATPVANPRLALSRKRIILKGDVPSPIQPPLGCKFHTRCPYVRTECAKLEPELDKVSAGHFVACTFVKEIEAIRAQM
jgi:oligopeptide transport system ATP-binding protein